MDQIKIGEFISSKRKEKSLTQAALAEKLGITDRAISKWERGKGLPDASLMLDLCEILDITVNELLCGESVSMEDNNQKNEQLLLDMAKEIEKKNKTIWTAMRVLMIAVMLLYLGGVFVAAFLVPEGVWQLVIVLGLLAIMLPACFYALKLEVSVGHYKCKNCGHEIVPTYSEALNAMHMGTTRHLKCPACGKRPWCKKVIKK